MLRITTIFLLALIPLIAASQVKKDVDTLYCFHVGEEILLDSTYNLWNYPDLEDEDYYCLGQYFAQNDISNGELIIQSYGDYEYLSFCAACKRDKLGIKLILHGDIIDNYREQFIQGYNSISKPFIQNKFGEDIFDLIYEIDTNKIEILEFYEELNEHFYERLETEILSDTSINLKMEFDSLAKRLNLDLLNLNLLVYSSTDKNKQETYNYYDIKNEGVVLFEHINSKYYFIYEVEIFNNPQFCSCQYVKKLRPKWNVPITVSYD